MGGVLMGLAPKPRCLLPPSGMAPVSPCCRRRWGCAGERQALTRDPSMPTQARSWLSGEMGACRVSQQQVGLGLGAALPTPALGLSLLGPGARGSSDGPGNPRSGAYAVAVLRGSLGVF